MTRPARIETPLALLAVTLLCASACGPAFTVTITSPESGLTQESTLTVTGTTAGPAAVQGVLVNGTTAITEDGFATWSATVPISIGANTIQVTATDESGHTAEASVTVTRPELRIFAAPATVNIVVVSGGPIPPAQLVTVTFTGPSVFLSGLSYQPQWLKVTSPV